MTSLLQEDDQPHIDPNKNYLEELVGEGKKFKDTQELAKGKYLADQMVEFKNRQFDELNADYLKLRQEYNAGPKLQEAIDRLLAMQQTPDRDNTPNANEVNDKPSFDPKEIESLVSSKIQEVEATRKQQENYNLVKNKLIERFGSNYQATLKTQIDDLGMTAEEADRLARNNPKVFLRTFELDKPETKENFQSPPRSSRNDRFAPNTLKRTWSYYQRMRAEQPDLYRQPKTQVQMLDDMRELGKEFEDGDFNI